MREKPTTQEQFMLSFFPYQRKWLQDRRQFKIGLWARQTGKDHTCAAEAVLECMTTSGKHWLILACGERQALESLAKAKEFARTIHETLGGGKKNSFNESSTELRFRNGSRITALPANPETVRGYSANVILTEFAFHHDPDAIWQAVYPSVTNPLRGGPKKLRIISTPNGGGNMFHRLWVQENDCFARHRVTIHEAMAQGLPINIAQLKAGMTNPEAWSQEYECQFVDQSSVLLPYSLIEQCETREATETCGDLSRCTGELFVGIDFGRKEDLTACWVLERVGDHLWTREVLTLPGMSTPAQAEILQPKVQRARRVCLDYTGPGVGLGDLLAEQFGACVHNAPHGKIELCSFSQPFKDELFPKVRAAFERQRIWLPVSPAIREDLHSVHRVVSSNGKFSYRASHRPDGHSDRCTALALALRAAESVPAVAAASSVGRKYRCVTRR